VQIEDNYCAHFPWFY